MAERDNEGYDPKHHYAVEKELAARLRAASTREERKALYGTIYDERIRRIPSHPLARRAASRDAQTRVVNRQLRLLNPFLTRETHFLDVGSGDCALALAVARRVARVYAVDVSRALSPASVPPPNYTFILSDGISVPVPPGSIDVALSNQVLEHLHPDDAQDHLREIRRTLRPGGQFICITPNRLTGPWDISRRYDRSPTGLHLREYSFTEVSELLLQAGFGRVGSMISFHGYRLSPLIPAAWVSLLERGLGSLPRGTLQRVGGILAAVKIVATAD